MTIYDAVMAIVVVLGMIRGAWRGFTWQVASIASLILGYWAARSQSDRFARYLPGEPEVKRVLAMALVYIAVSGTVFALAWLVRGTLRRLKFEAYDRHLGTLLGGIEGVGVGLLITLFLVSLSPATRRPIFSSPTGHVVGIIMDDLGPLLPSEVRGALAPYWHIHEAPGGDVADAEDAPEIEPPAMPPSRDRELQYASTEIPTAAQDSNANRTSSRGRRISQAIGAVLKDQLHIFGKPQTESAERSERR